MNRRVGVLVPELVSRAVRPRGWIPGWVMRRLWRGALRIYEWAEARRPAGGW